MKLGWCWATVVQKLTSLQKFAAKRRGKPIAISFPFVKPSKGKRMSEKQKNRDKIIELQETVDNQALQLAESVKLLSTLKKDVETLKDQVGKLKQLCSVDQ